MAHRIRSLVLASLLSLAVLAGCGAPATSVGDTQIAQSASQDTSEGAAATTSEGAAATTATSVATAATVLAENSAPIAADADADTSASAVQITLSEGAITADGAGVTVDGSSATITAAGTYQISGALDDGQIVVDSADDAPVRLILSGASITSAASAPLYARQAGSVVIILAGGTANYLADGATYADTGDDAPNAALFSEADLSIAGDGALTVVASYNDGIASKDGLLISGGTLKITAPDDGIRGKDELVITGGEITVTAGGDGLSADNADDPAKGYIAIQGGTLDLSAGGDGVAAATDLVATAGEVTIVAGGGSGATIGADQSAKGLKAGVGVTLDGGSFSISAAEDGVHADGDITINGGTLRVAAGDDGLHAEARLTIGGGDILVSEAYEGLEGADITLSGGTTSVVASDDGVNGAGGDGTADAGMGGPGGPLGGGDFTLTITDGTLVVDAGGDGIDVNGSITMSGGLVIVNGPTERMNGALDYDRGFAISGGTLIAVGSAGMAAAPDATSSQNVLLLNLSAAQPAGTIMHIADSAGNTILTFAPSKSYQSLVFSSPALVTGATYEVSLGGSAAGSATAGLYAGDYTPGSAYTSFTVSGVLTQLGSGGGRFR